MPSQHTCLTCQRAFIKRGTRPYRYCSPSCANIGRRVADQQCATCGTAFWSKVKRRFCSRACWRNRPQPLIDRFWAKVNKAGPIPPHRPEIGPCWVWKRVSGGGYGSIGTASGVRRSHRVSWELHYGPIPEGLDVCHRCDNRTCVRPDHLFLGTALDNIRDTIAKGRRHSFAGERNPSARLTAESVIALRSAAPRGRLERQAAADAYGISYGYLKRILNRGVWQHV